MESPVGTPSEENLCQTLLLLNEQHFPLTNVSTGWTNGESRYERVARLDDPHPQQDDLQVLQTTSLRWRDLGLQ